MAKRINVDSLRDLIYYCESDKLLKWKRDLPGCRLKDAPVLSFKLGGNLGTGYYELTLLGVRYLYHRLVYSICYGEIEDLSFVIDHINGDKSDNSKENLRLVPKYGNTQNQREVHQSNKSGFRGVSFCKITRKYKACISICNKTKYLGVYSSPEEAHNAYLEAKRHYHEFNTL